jgi:hypothetical protein
MEIEAASQRVLAVGFQRDHVEVYRRDLARGTLHLFLVLQTQKECQRLPCGGVFPLGRCRYSEHPIELISRRSCPRNKPSPVQLVLHII